MQVGRCAKVAATCVMGMMALGDAAPCGMHACITYDIIYVMVQLCTVWIERSTSIHALQGKLSLAPLAFIM